MDIAPTDILTEIFQHLCLKDLVKLIFVNKLYKLVVTKTKWTKYLIILYNVKHIEQCINNFNFVRFDFSFSAIDDLLLNKITSKHICYTLYLDYCWRLTDRSVRKLGHCNILSLKGCSAITDTSVKYLGHCRVLYLSYCHNITSDSIKYLNNCQYINLSGCGHICNSIIAQLTKCECLVIDYYYVFAGMTIAGSGCRFLSKKCIDTIRASTAHQIRASTIHPV